MKKKENFTQTNTFCSFTCIPFKEKCALQVQTKLQVTFLTFPSFISDTILLYFIILANTFIEHRQSKKWFIVLFSFQTNVLKTFRLKEFKRIISYLTLFPMIDSAAFILQKKRFFCRSHVYLGSYRLDHKTASKHWSDLFFVNFIEFSFKLHFHRSVFLH